jgi:hypothetical protein
MADVTPATTPEPDKQEDELKFSLPEDLDAKITKLHVKSVLDVIEKTLKGQKLNSGNVIRVAFACMHVVDNVKVQGVEKKKLLLTALDIYLEKDKSLDQEEKDMLYIMVHGVVAKAVDAKHSDDKDFHKSCCVIC